MPNPKLPGCRFHHVAIKAADYDKSRRFYTETLGFTPIREWGEGGSRQAMLDVGDGGCLELFAGGGANQPQGVWTHFALGVDDVDEAYRTALAGGAAPRHAPFDHLSGDVGIRIAFVSGPDGESIEFYSYR